MTGSPKRIVVEDEMAPIEFALATSAVSDWLQGRPTPICWLVGPAGSGKTAVLRAALESPERARVLSLSAASPDRCLQQVFTDRTTAGLFARLTAEVTGPLVLDALDTVQLRDEERAGQVTDLRFRHFLSAAARGRWPKLSTLVTSRLWPPRVLQANAMTIIELAAQPFTDGEPSPASGPVTVLEILASSRKASSGWLLGLLTGQPEAKPSLATPAAVRSVLEAPMSAGLVERVEIGNNGEWFQMPDAVRHRFLPPTRAAAVHSWVADGLESDEISRYVALTAEGDPELFHDLIERAMVHRLETADPQKAVQCYWTRLGNFSRLERENAIHLGVRACYTLNEGHPPQQLSPLLKESAGALAVINDWGLYALCAGDAVLAAEAALAAYGMITADLQPWDKSMLARHAAEALLARAQLPEAVHWAKLAEQHAKDGIRRNEGLPMAEVMSAYDHALFTLMRIAAATHDADGAAWVLSDMVEVHERARKVLSEYNRHAIVPLPGPSGEVNSEWLLDGRPAALVAVLTGRPDAALRILTAQLASWSRDRLESRQGLAIRTQLLRAQVAAEGNLRARESIIQLRRRADELDDSAARCELASMAADLALGEGDTEAALALANDFLELASSCGLRMLVNDLLKVRANALLALGRREEASAAAGAVLEMAAPPVVESPKPRRRSATMKEEPRAEGPQRRIQLHETALAAIEDYNTRGLPFALYFRKYDFTITHGPMELGPQLIENVLQAAIPPGAHMLTIQGHDDLVPEYTGDGSFLDRSAPALYLGDEQWQSVAASLIPFADMIVSECFMLGEGVRFELDIAYRTSRWDRTVLLLPPLRSPLAVIDSDPLVQMFPRCIWMDSFHTEALEDSPVVRDLLSRMEQIALLPEDDRRRLTDRAVRDEAYPIDLLPIAEHYESSAMWSSQWQDEDDRIRYYGFWELFRAASIRGVLLSRGDDSLENRVKLSESYVQMSAVQLDHEGEGDKLVLIGDLTFAEQCARSARSLLRESDGLAAFSLRERAENQLRSVLTVRSAVEAHPNRFVLRPRYGPFLVRAVPR